MDALALLLSRVQFAFTISFHIIFPSFSIGLSCMYSPHADSCSVGSSQLAACIERRRPFFARPNS
jgi:hypothetical protein